MTSIADLEVTIAALQRDLEKKKEALQAEAEDVKRKEFLRETTTRRLAILLHQCTCRGNHTDGCSWYYDTSWEEFSHKRELERAERILKALPANYHSYVQVDKLANAFAGHDVVTRVAEIEANKKAGWR